DLDDLRAAMATLTRERLACNQVLYHLGARGIERELIPFCQREGIAVVGYRPLRSLPGRSSAGLRVLTDIGTGYGKTPQQVALRFLPRALGVFAIPKASDPAHVRDNAGAAGYTLTAADIAAIDRAFPAPRRRVPLATA